MTRKDYKLIAEMINDGALVMSKVTLVDDVVAVFKKDNTRFDEAKFRKACGL